jgi:hypothetical protein
MQPEKFIITTFVFFSTIGHLCSQNENYFAKQLIGNINFGWTVDKTPDYRWRNIFFGTAYQQSFRFDEKMYWKVGAHVNFSKYTIYKDGKYDIFGQGMLRDRSFNTSSLTIPAYVGYNVYRIGEYVDFTVFGGAVFEIMTSASLDGKAFNEIKRGQWGLTVGTKIRFFNVLSTNLSYVYYPTGLLKNGQLNRSAINFSVGL